MGRAHEVRAASMAKTAAKKSAANGRAAKEIYMLAKQGGSDPAGNLALRSAIDKAKSNQIPNDVIQRAIKRAEGGDAESYTENRYEGFGPGKVGIIVDALTSNVNRAISTIRDAFNKGGGNLGSTGSVSFMFKHLAVFKFKGDDADSVMMDLLDKGIEVNDVTKDEDGVITVLAPFESFAAVKKGLDDMGIKDYIKQETAMVCDENQMVEVTDPEDQRKLRNLLNKLDELEDVQAVYHNAKNYDDFAEGEDN